MQPEATPEARKNQKLFQWNTLEDVSGPRTTQMVADRSPQ